MKNKIEKDKIEKVHQVIRATTAEHGLAQIEPQFHVERFGKTFVKANDYKKLVAALKQAWDEEEQVVSIREAVQGFPFDALRAVKNAMEALFGFTGSVSTWFAKAPVLSVQTGIDTSENVIFGTFRPPQLQGGAIAVQFYNFDTILIVADVMKKFEPVIKGVAKLARKLMREDSIYRGKAIQLDLSYLDTGENWFEHQPTFIDNSQEVTLVLPRVSEFELETSVWGLLRNTQAFRDNGIPVKHGVLLKGTFGTGKTLISYRTSQIAGESGWTYIYLKSPDHFAAAHRMAKFVAPCVLFVEDVDVIMGGNRSAEMNEILETLDGVASKGSEIITVFTTNSPEKINPAFMRSGRMDTQIELTPFDAEAAARFVKLTENGCLEHEADYEAIGKAFADLVPADITEGINKAKRAAIAASGTDIGHVVTTEQMVSAGEFMRRQRGIVQTPVSAAEQELQTIREAYAITREGIDEIIGKRAQAKVRKLAARK